MKAAFARIGMVLMMALGAWLMLGTFIFDIAPLWYIVLHCVAALVYIGFAPMVLDKLAHHATYSEGE